MNTQPSILDTLRKRLHEAAIPLMDGESLGAFSGALDSAAKGFVRETLGIAADDANYAWVWVCDIRPGDVAVEVEYKDARGAVYYLVPWTRAENGDFGFKAPVEVVRKVTYEPVAATARAMDSALKTREEEAIEDLLATNDLARELPTQANIVKLNRAVAEAEDFAREVMGELRASGQPTERIDQVMKLCLEARIAQARRRR